MDKFYLQPDRLCELVRLAQAGEFKIELVQAITSIAVRLGADEDEVQTALLKVLRSLRLIDPDDNVFAYLSQVCKSIIYELRRNEATYQRNVHAWAVERGAVWRWGNGKPAPLRFQPAG